MRRLHRWTLIASTAFVVLLLVLVLGVSWIAGQGLLHPERKVPAATPGTVGLNWTYANFTTVDGAALVGWWMPTDATPHDNATVLFLHGYGDSKNQSLAPAQFLVAAGYNVLSFDFRACGQSGGDHTTAGILEVRDVEAAVDWLLRQPGFEDDPKIALMGWSMGGSTAINAAASLPQVDAVVADGAYSHLQNIVDTSIGKFLRDALGFTVPRWPIGPLAVMFAGWSVGVDLDDAPPVDAIGRLDVPVLLIQGGRDTTVVPGNVDELVAHGGDQVEVHRVANGTHASSLRADPEGYPRVVLDFLGRSLDD